MPLGMFLYARLVFDNLESQSNLDSVRNEANNLPEGLDEALVLLRWSTLNNFFLAKYA
jgi:hypothetical protein